MKMNRFVIHPPVFLEHYALETLQVNPCRLNAIKIKGRHPFPDVGLDQFILSI